MSTQIDVRPFELKDLINAFEYTKSPDTEAYGVLATGYPTYAVQVPSSGFCPALIVRRWRKGADVHASIYLFRWGIARRAALSRGAAQVLPSRSRDVAEAGFFSMILPCPLARWRNGSGKDHGLGFGHGYGWMLSCTDWCRETEAEATQLMREMKAPGGLMEGRSMQVLALSTLRKFEDRTL